MIASFTKVTQPDTKSVDGYRIDSAEQGVSSALTTFDQTQEPVNLVVLAQVSQAMLEVNDEGRSATWGNHVTDAEYAAAPPTTE